MTPKLRIPRKFTRFTLVDTSDNIMLNDNEVDPNTEEVALSTNSLSEEVLLTTDSLSGEENIGCFGWVRSKWFWRQELEKKNREKIINQIQTIGVKIDNHEATMIEIEQELKKCKKNKNKKRARLFLLKRKRLSNTIQSYYNSRSELEQVLISLEESSDQVALVTSYKTANKILKTTMRQRGGSSAVETYEDLADELQEAQDDVNELQEAVSRNIGRDNDLMEELDEMFENDSPSIKPTTGGSSSPPPQVKVLTDTEILESLPSVPLPHAPIHTCIGTDKDALRELEDPITA